MNLDLHRKIVQEMPYIHAGSMEREAFWNSFISNTSLVRLYGPLGAIQAGSEYVELHNLKNHPRVIGTVKAQKDGEESNRIVFSLRFKVHHTLVNVPPGVDEARVIQVDKVSTERALEGMGIASYAYSELVKLGHVILSDTSQFDEGRRLWVRMATKAHLRNYEIFVLDDEFGFIERDGKPVVYDGSNIDDAEIWTTGEDYSGAYVLLLMK